MKSKDYFFEIGEGPVLSDKYWLFVNIKNGDNGCMSNIRDTDIYPKFEFRLSHEDKAWLLRELSALKEKFSDSDENPAITKNVILLSALKHGLAYLKARRKLCSGDQS